MNSTGIAATYAATTQAQTQQSLMTEMLKMSQSQDANLVALLQSGAENLEAATQSAPPPGLGTAVDISA